MVQENMYRRHIFSGWVLVWTLLCAAPAVADTVRYSLEIQNRVPVSYSLEIPVQYEGSIVVEADWECNRVLSFRLESPGATRNKVRRSGPSPQKLEIEVTRADLETGEPFRLGITSLPTGGAGKGLLLIHRPDSPRVVKERIEAMQPPEPDIAEPEWWKVPASPPTGADDDLLDLFLTVELFRAMVLPDADQVATDPCRWQTALLERLAEHRESIVHEERFPAEATARFYRRIAALVSQVDELNHSRDPILTGPPPEDRSDLRQWLRMRQEWVKPLEHELDILMDMPEDGYVPELADLDWPTRFVSCLMACERNFEARTRTGQDEAANQDLATGTWPFILAAADAMEAVAKLVELGHITLAPR
jgi:hypothetical protein